MNKLLVLTTALLLGAATLSAPVSAQDRSSDRDDRYQRSDDSRDDDDRNRRSDDRRGDYRRGDDRRSDDHRGDDRRSTHRRDGRHDNRYQARRHYKARTRYIQPRGYRADRWNVGTRLPSGYYGSSYYVDHRSYQLRSPPRGYRWVRVDNDVYLVSTRNGLVSDIMYGLFR